MGLLRNLIRFNTDDEDLENDIDMELRKSNNSIFHNIYGQGTILLGYDYGSFLEHQIYDKFKYMVDDFRKRLNPYPFEKDDTTLFVDFEHNAFTLSRTVEYMERRIVEYKNGDYSSISDLLEGDTNADNKKME